MGLLFLSFVYILGILGTAFMGFFVYRLDTAPEMTPTMQQVNRMLLVITGLVLVSGMALSFIAEEPLASWGQFASLAGLALMMLFLAARALGSASGRWTMMELAFCGSFSLAARLSFVMAFAPAFVAFITYSTKL